MNNHSANRDNTTTTTTTTTTRWTKVVASTKKKENDNNTTNNDGSNKSNNNNNNKKTKSARKNERRKELKRLKRKEQKKSQNGHEQQQQQQQLNDVTADVADNDDMEDEILLARMVSLEENNNYSNNNNNNSNVDPRRKRLRKLKKKLSEANALSSKLVKEQLLLLDEEQRRKVEQIPCFQEEIECLEKEIEIERLARLEKERQEQEALQKANKERLAEWQAWSEGAIVQGFFGGGNDDDDDDEFACPLCAGPLEAAMTTIPCEHVFCRACLEDSLAAAADRSKGDPTAIVCPLCRSLLLDSSSSDNTGKLQVTVRAAERTRRKMKKKKCVCRCGTELSLGSLRIHLRTCSEGAPALFGGDKRKCFGHEKFQQPKLDPTKVQLWKNGGKQLLTSSSRMDIPEEYDEEAEIQAAILMSLNIGV